MERSIGLFETSTLATKPSHNGKGASTIFLDMGNIAMIVDDDILKVLVTRILIEGGKAVGVEFKQGGKVMMMHY